MKRLVCGCKPGQHDTKDGYEPCETVDCCDECEKEMDKDLLSYVPDGLDATKLCEKCLNNLKKGEGL